MVIPVGDTVQWLLIVEKDEKGNIKKKNWSSVRFVPLRGEYGFKSIRY
jgi:protein-L-isoaspartate O-methyltransferase